MAGRARKKKPRTPEPPPAEAPPDPPEPNLPAPESIISETPFRSPKGRTYRIIKTTEVDAYEEEGEQKARRKPKR